MGGAKVLIVEDDLIMAMGMQATLERHGYVVTSNAVSCEEALESVAADYPDVVLMDIELSGKIDGISTARSIKRNHRELPVIFLTQRPDDETFRNAMESSPDSYISKPFSDGTLLRAIELALYKAAERKKEVAGVSQAPLVEWIFVPHNKGKVKLLFRDILYIEAVRAYSDIYCEAAGENNGGLAAGKDGKRAKAMQHFTVAVSSNNLVKQIAYRQIVQIHRSYYINIDKIERVENDLIYINGIGLPVGDKYNDDNLKRILRSVRDNNGRK